MKKVLLMTVAMMTMSVAANAQGQQKALNSKADVKAAIENTAAVACDEVYSSVAKKSRRVIADGVSYARPEGTFYGLATGSTYLYIPYILDVTYKNYATDKEKTSWQYGYSTLYDIAGDENNDLTTDWPKVDRGYINSAYVPTLTDGSVSYRYADELGKRNYLINGDSLLNITNVNFAGGYYTGFSNAAIFGTYSTNRTLDDGTSVLCKRKNVIEFFSKPIAPLCVYSFDFNIISRDNEDMNFIPEGTTMTLSVIKLDDNGNFTNEAITIPFTKDDIQEPEAESGNSYGFISVSKKTVDDFGTEILEPVVIDYPFAIMIDGFHQEGVNFSLYMVNVMATERDYYRNAGGVEGTVGQYYRTDNGELFDDGALYYIQSSDTRQYNAAIWLNGMFDVAQVIKGFENMTAPVEGGSIFAEFVEENEETGEPETVRYSTLQYYTTCPRLSDWEGTEGFDNYQFEGLPDWLTVEGYNDNYYEDNYVTLAQIVAAPLPAGVEGRQAEIRIVSDKGADSGVITITQGTISTDISATKANAKVADAAMFNMAGQRVNDSFKGLVIKNGQKFMNK